LTASPARQITVSIRAFAGAISLAGTGKKKFDRRSVD
jgi:hypothetical protein